jgi:hypothetical protein
VAQCDPKRPSTEALSGCLGRRKADCGADVVEPARQILASSTWRADAYESQPLR